MCVPREVLAKFVGREMIAVRILASDSDFRGNFNKGRDCALESCDEASYCRFVRVADREEDHHEQD